MTSWYQTKKDIFPTKPYKCYTNMCIYIYVIENLKSRNLIKKDYKGLNNISWTEQKIKKKLKTANNKINKLKKNSTWDLTLTQKNHVSVVFVLYFRESALSFVFLSAYVDVALKLTLHAKLQSISFPITELH